MATNYNFSDVFVSYSHDDRQVVRKIADGLVAKGYEIWADWEDIPRTVDWWQEIKAGIDASNTFTFFVSPNSAQSEVCYQEVQHAVDNHKRIVPILCKPIDDDATLGKLHPAIRTHNWLIFDGERAFEDNIQQLIDTLTLDIEYLRLHTRYLVRAREWDEQNRDTSFLLRGRDAEEALTWLNASGDKSPNVLPIHDLYIMQSMQRRQEDREHEQQRNALRFVEFRILPTLFIAWPVLLYYTYSTYPDMSVVGYQRLTLTFGISFTPSVLLAALVLIADELTSIRYNNNRLMRMGYSFVYSFALSSSMLGFLQQMFAQARLDLATVFLGWLGLGLPVWMRSSFKLRGWQTFLISCITMFLLINFTHQTPDNPWMGDRLPLFYFNDASELYSTGIMVAFIVSLACYFTPMMTDFWSLLPQTWQDRTGKLFQE